MSNSSNQLEDVFQEVSEYFAGIEGITVAPGAEMPPEEYTITYHLNGACKEKDGDVTICNTHIISISLPFGFPHFPPNCIPDSPTFHPDFDSSAISIGDTWEENKSIVELILHIGRMIGGEIYSKSNAFNEEAAEWYQDNSDRLPFEKADFVEQEIAPEPMLEEEDDDDDDDFGSIDTLDDDVFNDSFSIEQEEPVETVIDADHLQLMAQQKRFHALSRELNRIPDDFDGRAQFETEMQKSLDSSAKLFREAEELEHLGKLKEALHKFNTIEGLVADYPRLQDAKGRVQQAFDLLGDWVNGGQDTSSTIPPDDHSEETQVSKPGVEAQEQRQSRRKFFEDTKADGKKWIISALAIGSVALGATIILSYFSLGSSFKKAKDHYYECQQLLNEDNFQGAEEKCEETLILISEVRIVKQNKKALLKDKVETLLQSPKLTQGLAGNIMFEGKYVSLATKGLILTFKEAKKNGDAFYKQKRWHEAAKSYTRASNAAKQTNDAIDTVLLADLRSKMPIAQFNSYMLAGEKSLASSDWNKATEHFSKALQLAKANPNVLLEDITQLELLSNQAEFNLLRHQGHQNFKDGKWENALANYHEALALVKKLNLEETDTITGLHENIARTNIYMAIESGKTAFAASQWDEVIKQYEKAIALLEKNSELLSSINTEESGEKLSRIMLHAAIIRDKQSLAKFLKEEDYEAAVKKLRTIKQTITQSPFADRAEFQLIKDEVTTQLRDTKEKLLIRKNSAYLTDNFKRLFLKHYPASTNSVLSSPKVEYLKRIGNKLLFRLQCTEKAGGRPLRLQMDYLYSPANGSWRFYSEQ